MRAGAGELTVSRALGDFHLEQLKFRDDGGSFAGPLTAEPEVRATAVEPAVRLSSCQCSQTLVLSMQPKCLDTGCEHLRSCLRGRRQDLVCILCSCMNKQRL